MTVAGPPPEPDAPRPAEAEAASPRAGSAGAFHGGRRAADPRRELLRLAEQIAAGSAAVVPAWRRRTVAESRWPVTLTVMVAVALQQLLPDRLALHPVFLLPVLEGALFVGLLIANPVRFERRGAMARTGSIVLILLVTVANAASAVLLVRAIVENKGVGNPVQLLTAGGAVWATNVIAFAL